MSVRHWPGEPQSMILLDLVGLGIEVLWPHIGGPLLLIAVARMGYVLLRDIP